MSSKIMYLAHNGVDHSAGATHETSRDSVNAALVVVGLTLLALVLMAGILMLVKRTFMSKPAVKGKK